MYRSLKRTDGTYSFSGYYRRALQLVGFSELRQYFQTHMPEAGLATRIGLSLDYYGCLIRYGAVVCDYFEYEFWKKRDCVRKQYITKAYSRKIQKTFNTGSIERLSNKRSFNEYFSDFRPGLQCFYFDEPEEAFLSFVRDCDRDVIAKTFTGVSGRGIHLPDVSTDEKAREVYRKLKAEGDFFVERVFRQTGVLHEIHPRSVNTVRVFTLYDQGEAHIMFAAVRFGGSDRPVDNIHANGLVCEVDLQSGCVIGRGYNLKGDSFIRHPVTQKMLLGVQIPNWQKVCDMVVQAARMLPELGYIGWDVAVSDDAVCLIEGNECANVDVSQVCAQRGLKPLYEPFMRNRKA